MSSPIKSGLAFIAKPQTIDKTNHFVYLLNMNTLQIVTKKIF